MSSRQWCVLELQLQTVPHWWASSRETSWTKAHSSCSRCGQITGISRSQMSVGCDCHQRSEQWHKVLWSDGRLSWPWCWLYTELVFLFTDSQSSIQVATAWWWPEWESDPGTRLLVQCCIVNPPRSLWWCTIVSVMLVSRSSLCVKMLLLP